MNKSYQNFKKRTGKLAVALTLAGATVVGGMAIGADAATYTNGYTNTSVKLKAGTSTSSSVLTTIKANQQVRVLGTSGNLLKVSYNGKTGYVAKTAIKNQYKITDCSYEVTTKKALTVRKGPGSAFVSAGRLAGDETVTVEGKTNNGWYLITYKGSKAYIPSGSNYVKYTINYTVTPCSYDVRTKLDLTVRQGAGQGYLSAGRLPEGTTVRVKGKTSNGWYLVDIGGVTRYIPSGSRYVYRVENNNNEGVNNAPTINALDKYTVEKGNVFNPKYLGITATDTEDGDLTDKIVYSIGTYDTNSPTCPNQMIITATVTDSSNKTTTRTFVVEITKNDAPQIIFSRDLSTGQEKRVVEVKEGNPMTVPQVIQKLGVTAKNKDGHDISSRIWVYMRNVKWDKAGNYTAYVSAIDADGRVSNLEPITISVKASIKPEIVIKPDLDTQLDGYKVVVGKGSGFNLNDLKAMLQPHVEYAGNTVPSSQATITYTGTINSNVVDVYKVTLEVTFNGETNTKVIYVNVKDNKEPKIEVRDLVNGVAGDNYSWKFEKDPYNDTGVLKVKLGTTIDKDMVGKFIKVTDEDGDDVTWDISDVKTNSIGIRQLTITAKDANGAKVQKVIDVRVVEGL